MGWTHIERVRLDTCDDTNPTFGGPASLRFEGQDILVLEGLEIDDILALDKPMSPDWAVIMDARPPSLEESAPVKILLVGPYLSSLVRMAKWIGNGITTVKHYLNLIGTTLADLRYFDQWVRFYRGVCAKYPEDYSPEGHADFILQVFLIFRWLDPLLVIECRPQSGATIWFGSISRTMGGSDSQTTSGSSPPCMGLSLLLGSLEQMTRATGRMCSIPCPVSGKLEWLGGHGSP